jgi:ATP-dependent Clp protease ATP-binding subunit ClpB
MSNFDLTEKAKAAVEGAVQIAKDNSNAQVYPAHIAAALLNDAPSTDRASFLSSVISKAGGDPVLFNRAVQKTIVRLPTQDPPPEDTSLNNASIKLLREAQSIQKTMVRMLSKPPPTFAHPVVSTTRTLPKTILYSLS